MRAWVLHTHGVPRSSLALQERPDPVPSAGQVLVRCEGSGLNYADVQAVKGVYRDAPPVPFVPGYEVVGRVERLGEGVQAGLLGRRVVAITRFGGYAELAITDHRALTVIPDELPLGEAAALATQGCTAWYMATMARPLRAGEHVLVHGAAGGVGQLLVRIAVRRGCVVYAVASGAEKMQRLRELGAQHPIDRSTCDYAREVERLLGDRKLDVSFNPVGGATFPKDMRLLGSAGAQVLFGGSERGERPGLWSTLRFVWNMGLLVPVFLMMKSRSVIGVNMLRIGEGRPDVLETCLQEVVKAHAEGWYKPLVHREYTAKYLPAGLEELSAGRTMGKLVVRW